jgi:hypothetical protein
MTSSLNEIEHEIVQVNDLKKQELVWHQKILAEREKAKRQFEEDNLFYFGKKIWNKFKIENIIIKRKNIIMPGVEYKEKKKMLMRGVKVDWSSMLELKIV